ncbi:hypothetical protein ES332_A12G258900v1 [Gossypium tomentosum]|uniref:Uncharacterized protein n=1 Tax=Gossypium tomentosum TaxID=34277 RepID=A0A5D2N2S4_GOSTO|nr:hypothetical protein ES332_A12G258900v1 [Gossypium tomentosum]
MYEYVIGRRTGKKKKATGIGGNMTPYMVAEEIKKTEKAVRKLWLPPARRHFDKTTMSCWSLMGLEKP